MKVKIKYDKPIYKSPLTGKIIDESIDSKATPVFSVVINKLAPVSCLQQGQNMNLATLCYRNKNRTNCILEDLKQLEHMRNITNSKRDLRQKMNISCLSSYVSF